MKISNKLKTIKLSDIKPYSNNVKQHEDDQVQLIRNGLHKFGYYSPIGVDKDNVIVLGHARYYALCQNKAMSTDVEVYDFSGLDDDEIKKLRIYDNKSNESEWDFQRLEIELRDMYTDLDNIDTDLGIDKSFLNKMKKQNQFLHGDDKPSHNIKHVCPECGCEF